MKVYIAAPYEARWCAQLMAPQLAALGCTVIASWLRQQNPESAAEAAIDLADIDEAEAIVVLNPPGFERSGTGGRHVELGYAIGRGKRVILMGAKTNVFHHLTSIVRVETLEALFELLTAVVSAQQERR